MFRRLISNNTALSHTGVSPEASHPSDDLLSVMVARSFNQNLFLCSTRRKASNARTLRSQCPKIAQLQS
ncbi:MAG: hypothetical protein HOP11_03525 [Saprospiraceae bacterium]|nr:hypothetical protein [Saprospiraceae bacterium]